MKKLYSLRTSGLRRLANTLFVLAAILTAGLGSAYAQGLQVSGKVTDAQGGGVPGVTVFVKGNNVRGTVTDTSGAYTLNVPSQKGVLVFKYLGYKTQEAAINSRTTIDIVLEEDAAQMDEVVVVGYGTQKKQFLVGSVSQVNSKELLKAPMSNVSNMMTGKLPGVTSIQRSGIPGADETMILVRGASTFNDSSPLCLVDGVERMMNTVNPNDIASISILKDAATAAIYGVRGANGVIMITTKSGSEGPTTISYDGSATFTQNSAMPELLNANDYVYWHNKAREMDNLKPYYTPQAIASLKEQGIYGDTDWLGKIYKQFGLTHQHNLSVTGGSQRVKYYTSLGLMSQDGILRNTNYDRYNLRTNIDAKIAKNLSFAINVGAFYEDQRKPGYNISPQSEFSPISAAIYMLPILKDTYNDLPMSYNNGSNEQSPVSALEESGFQEFKRWQFESNAKLEYNIGGAIKPLEGLKIALHGVYNFSYSQSRNYLRQVDLMSFRPDQMTVLQTVSSGVGENNFNKSASHYSNTTLRPQITYDRTFGLHAISGLVLYEQYKSNSDTMTGYKKGYFQTYPIDLSTGLDNMAPYVSGSFSHAGTMAFAGRFNYAYDRKYIAEVTFRADASYKFAPGHRWGFFPSAAVGWVISEEKFFKEALPKVDFMKFRASYGEMGSDDTSPYFYLPTYISTSPSFSYIAGGKPQASYYTSGYVYDNLTWSRSRSFNVGIEASLWGGKLGVEFDWFYKLTSDILENQGGAYAPSLGGNFPSIGNTGRVDNRGFELVLKHRNQFASGWYYSLTGSLSWSRNRVLSRRIADDHPSYRAILGQPMGHLYGFQALGLFQTQEQLDNTPAAPSGSKNLGDLMYRDVNGDGKIDQEHDFVNLGYGTVPEMNFSLNMEFGWKNLYLTALWQGVALCSYQLSGTYGHGTMDNTMFTRPFYSNGNAPYYLVENAWTPEHTNAEYPRLSSVSNGNNAWTSSWWTKRGDYLRLKNLQIGYTLPKHLLEGTGLGRVNIYLAGTNLWTISAFKYVDPEMPSVNNGYYPQQRTYSVGLNLTF